MFVDALEVDAEKTGQNSKIHGVYILFLFARAASILLESASLPPDTYVSNVQCLAPVAPTSSLLIIPPDSGCMRCSVTMGLETSVKSNAKC